MKNGRSSPFQIVEFGEIPVFLPFKTRFRPRSNPFFTPFQPVFYPVFFPFLPLSFPVLVPFLYCLAIISNMRHFQPNHWTTSDHHWSAGPVGGLYLWRGDAQNQFVRYVLLPRMGASKAAASGRR